MKHLLLLTLIVACGPARENLSVYNGKNGEPCTTEQFDAGALLNCGDTVSVIYNGRDGVDGNDGADGRDGRDGEQGPPGIAGTTTIVNASDIKTYSGGCSAIEHTNFFVKTNGTNASFYTSQNCAANSKVGDVNDGESIWFSDSLLGVKSKNTFKVINFGV